MNGAINILKLIFAFTIVMVHCGTFFGYENFGWFQGAFIYVEWFYIFAGYTLARKVMRMERKLPLCETTAGLLKQRILALLPYYWLSCCIALVLKMSTGLIEIDDPILYSTTKLFWNDKNYQSRTATAFRQFLQTEALKLKDNLIAAPDERYREGKRYSE